MNIIYIIFPIFILVFLVLLLVVNDGKIKIDGLSSYYLLLLLFFFYISIVNASFVSLRYSILIAVWFLTYLITTQVITNINTKKDSAWLFMKAINLTLFLFIFISLIYHFFFGELLRLYGLNRGLGPNEIALYSASGLIMSAQLLNKFKKFYYYLFIAIFFSALILTGSRTSILAIFLILVWLIFKGILYFKAKISRRYLFLLILLLAGTPFFIYASGLFILRFYTEITLAFKLSDDLLTNPMLTSYRLQGLFVAKDILFDSFSNFIIGVGFENYRVLYSRLLEEYFDGSTMTLHSVYLQILVGGGITTLTLYLIYLYKLIITSLKIKDKILRNTILYLVYLNLFYMLLGSTFVNRLIYFIIPAIVYLGYKNQKKPYI